MRSCERGDGQPELPRLYLLAEIQIRVPTYPGGLSGLCEWAGEGPSSAVSLA